MAALVRRPVLHISQNPDDFLGVSTAEEDGNFIVSSAKTASHIVDARNGKIKASWFLSPGYSIHHKIIFDPHNKKYLTLTKPNEIRTFGISDKIEKAEKVGSGINVHAVLTFQNQEPILVLQNGQVCKVSNAGDFCKSSVDTNQQILYCTQTKVKTDDFVCVLSKEGERHLLLKVWDGKSLDKAVAETTVTLDDDVAVQSVCHCQDTTCFKLLALLTNGCLLNIVFYYSSQQFDDVILPKVEMYSSRMKIYATSSAEHIVIAPIVKDSSSNVSGVGVWNINYCTRQAWTEVDEQVQCMFTCGDYLFLVDKREVKLYFSRFGISNLIDVVGKGTTSAVPSTGSLVSWRVHETSEKNLHEELHMLLNNAVEKQGSIEHFTDLLQNFVDKLPKNLDKTTIILLQPKIDKVWQNCIDKKLCPGKSLSILLRLNLVSKHLLPDVIELILHHQATRLLRKLLFLQNIPEKSLIQILSYILKQIKISKGKNDPNPQDTDNLNILTSLLKVVLARPYSDVFLLENLRDMNFEEVLTLLEYFMEYFSTINEDTNNERQSKIIDWLNIVIDAHFTQLILSPDAHPHLIKLHEIIVNEVHYLDDCIQLQAVLVQLKEKCALPKKKGVGMYCIEVLEF